MNNHRPAREVLDLDPQPVTTTTRSEPPESPPATAAGQATPPWGTYFWAGMALWFPLLLAWARWQQHSSYSTHPRRDAGREQGPER